MSWSVGDGIGNVFDDAGKLVCTVATPEIAARIVAGVNGLSRAKAALGRWRYYPEGFTMSDDQDLRAETAAILE